MNIATACSKKMERGQCKREVIFWAEFHGRRHNACVVHLGDILVEQQMAGRATITWRSRVGGES